MRFYDIIKKKRDGLELSQEEIEFFAFGAADGSIPDYQLTAMLMAIFFKGMSKRETADLTLAMANSGDTVDLSQLGGITADKHSTGGVGDKTTLIVAPIVASCGVKVAKMSGRGLGHTGGTVDKLESIPGYKTTLTREEFFGVVEKSSMSVIGQSGNLAPADKKLYALRDVTATVDSIPLIASSIMSKKIAAGAACIVLDIKVGSGAFMKTPELAQSLAREMIDIGTAVGRRTAAVISNMDVPLGINVGNSLEVIEAVETLKGNGPEDLKELCICLAANMLVLAGKGSEKECTALARAALESGRALETLKACIEAQGGDSTYLDCTDKFPKAKYSFDIVAESDGYITKMDSERIGIAACMLGAGRKTANYTIDFAAGLKILKKTGSKACKGDILATLYTNDKALFTPAAKEYTAAVTLGNECPEVLPIIISTVR